MATQRAPDPNASTTVKAVDSRSEATAYVTKANITYPSATPNDTAEQAAHLSNHRGTTTTRVAGQSSFDPAA